MRATLRQTIWLPLVLAALACPTSVRAQTSPSTATGATPIAADAPAAHASTPRYLIYFDEFSAYLSPRAKTIIASVAKRAKATDARSITVQARASATGTVETNKYLAMTRASIVADELKADGIAPSMIEQQPIGQTGSNDPTVYNRRVDIIINR
ncbi:MAG: OmpA family protein [Stellaceae bacterium]